ncbi:hypothetical protein RB620_24970 [Paenibacillus sp. LHD-117]|uniref:hypothetical protein n=1 Tax=Paenibacillus sp. LHD-117 TaxID=3071412 RepID=UPI0027E0708A|nr:hypothetical protein [Paenibacillus sp. LHD-117]MDQ6422691.1 hypothetical protein [Paenibacillus sp. LHD-117]
MAKNKSLYSTPAEGVSLRPGTGRVLTQNDHHHHDSDGDHEHHHHHHHHHDPGIDVREYATLRLLATNRGTSVSNVYVTLLSTRNGETSYTLGRVRLAPGESYTNTYSVPGDYVNIRVYAARYEGGCRRRVDTIDVQLYGHK